MEDGPGMLKELASGMRQLINERLVSPLLPAFTLSWLVVNYRLLFVLFSDEAPAAKFSLIDTALYPTADAALINGFILPLSIALIYIFAYPYPAKLIYQYSLKRQRELRDARQQVEKATVLTLEESQRLRTYYFDRESKLQKTFQTQQEELNQLRAKIADLEQSDSPKTDNRIPSTESLASRISKWAKELSDTNAKILAALAFSEERERDYQSERELKKYTDYSITTLRVALDDLLTNRLVDRTYGADSEPRYSLTDLGRRAFLSWNSSKTTSSDYSVKK